MLDKSAQFQGSDSNIQQSMKVMSNYAQHYAMTGIIISISVYI